MLTVTGNRWKQSHLRNLGRSKGNDIDPFCAVYFHYILDSIRLTLCHQSIICHPEAVSRVQALLSNYIPYQLNSRLAQFYLAINLLTVQAEQVKPFIKCYQLNSRLAQLTLSCHQPRIVTRKQVEGHHNQRTSTGTKPETQTYLTLVTGTEVEGHLNAFFHSNREGAEEHYITLIVTGQVEGHPLQQRERAEAPNSHTYCLAGQKGHTNTYLQPEQSRSGTQSHSYCHRNWVEDLEQNSFIIMFRIN
jgi:hypothetical protein